MAEGLNQQRLNLVASAFLFENVDEIVVERIVTDDKCYKQRYEKGEIVFDETHFVRALGIILSGEVQVEKAAGSDKNLKMSRIGPGGCFGAAAMFQNRQRYPNRIMALRHTEILFLPEELLQWFMQRNPVITQNYITYLSERIWFLNTKISALTAGNAEQKLAVYLLENGGVAQSMTELSQTLNMGRATLYRAIEALERQGLIHRGNKTLEILDADGLEKMIR